MPVENNLRVALDVAPLRALLAMDPDLRHVRVQRLARGVALTGAVGSAEAADRAVGLAAASIPEDMLVEDNLEVGLDLGPLRSLMAGEPGLDGVQVQRVGRGVALSGEVASAATADRGGAPCDRVSPEGMPVENNLRVALDVGPLRALLARDPDLRDVRCSGWRAAWLSVARWAPRRLRIGRLVSPLPPYPRDVDRGQP